MGGTVTCNLKWVPLKSFTCRVATSICQTQGGSTVRYAIAHYTYIDGIRPLKVDSQFVIGQFCKLQGGGWVVSFIIHYRFLTGYNLWHIFVVKRVDQSCVFI